MFFPSHISNLGLNRAVLILELCGGHGQKSKPVFLTKEPGRSGRGARGAGESPLLSDSPVLIQRRPCHKQHIWVGASDSSGQSNYPKLKFSPARRHGKRDSCVQKVLGGIHYMFFSFFSHHVVLRWTYSWEIYNSKDTLKPKIFQPEYQK